MNNDFKPIRPRGIRRSGVRMVTGKPVVGGQRLFEQWERENGLAKRTERQEAQRELRAIAHGLKWTPEHHHNENDTRGDFTWHPRKGGLHKRKDSRKATAPAVGFTGIEHTPTPRLTRLDVLRSLLLRSQKSGRNALRTTKLAAALREEAELTRAQRVESDRYSV